MRALRFTRVVLFTATACTAVTALAAVAVPKEAQATIKRVHAAASNVDYAALRQAMVNDFQWSFGGDRDAGQAIDAWKSDSRYLQRLKRVTAQPCGYITRVIVECPANARTGSRAGFEKTPAGWRMSYFVEGD